MVASTPGHPGPGPYDRNGLQILDPDACRILLGSALLGRIGLSVGALPVVLPVNFLFDGERILIRTMVGTMLHQAARGSVVAFEVDDIDPVYHSGWSVVVTGRAYEIIDQVELEGLRRAPLARWARTPAERRIVAIEPDIISGRRIVPGHPLPEERSAGAPW